MFYMVAADTSRREFLKYLGVGAVVAAGTAQGGRIASPLELLAQGVVEREFDMFWRGKDDRYIFKAPTADGVVLEQQVATGDPNYKAVLTYIGRLGKDNLLSEWEVVANVYASGNSNADSRLRRAGRVNSDGRFVFDDAKAEIVGKAYQLAMNALSSSVLATVQNGTPDLVKYWVADTTRKYNTLKNNQNLPPLPEK